MTAAITTLGLTKDYGGGHGLFDLDLEVAAGEVLGFLGPNGAGKSTAQASDVDDQVIRVLAGGHAVDHGRVLDRAAGHGWRDCRGLCLGVAAQAAAGRGRLAGRVAPDLVQRGGLRRA